MNQDLKHSPLNEEHQRLKARMVPFAGWLMPVQYAGIIAEYEAARRETALFDTSHMGEFMIEGDPRATGLDRIVSQGLGSMPAGTCRYGLMFNEDGGVLDDLIVYRLEEERWMLVVNAGTAQRDFAHLQRELIPGAALSDVSSQWAKIDVQGPGSRDLLAPLVDGIGALKYFRFDTFSLLGEQVIVSRTGYTGELGYEIYFPWDRMPELWRTLTGRGAVPAGLGARDVLRLEMGYSLYGHELDDKMDSLDTGLERFIDWQKDFIGKKALLRFKETGKIHSVMGLLSETRRSPRSGHTVFDQKGQRIGMVTSGTFSPFFQRGAGLVRVVPAHVRPEERVAFGSDAQRMEAKLKELPVYRKASVKA